MIWLWWKLVLPRLLSDVLLPTRSDFLLPTRSSHVIPTRSALVKGAEIRNLCSCLCILFRRSLVSVKIPMNRLFLFLQIFQNLTLKKLQVVLQHSPLCQFWMWKDSIINIWCIMCSAPNSYLDPKTLQGWVITYYHGYC